MQFAAPLIRGTLLRRYKRFLADVKLSDGSEATAHCANPGAMLGVSEPGATVWLEPNDDPKRKLKLSWKLIELPGGHMAGIDTSVPNKVAGEALRARAIPGLAAYGVVRPERKYGTNSRIDFLLTEPGLPDAYVEVKNVHLRREGDLAEFPDSVTARGAKHLEELSIMARQGARAVMLYVLQRTDVSRLSFAADLDPAYAAAAARAAEAGVEMIAHRTHIGVEGVTLSEAAPVLVP
ncbi:MAG: DNA/RNA nuclease SfsA [Pseudomonadota bacterium]